MDYTTQSLVFRIKKVIRYIRLYGISRTLIKVKGQYHMKKQYDTLPEIAVQPNDSCNVGLIGCGNYSYSNIAYYLKKNYGRVMKASMDIDINKAASVCEEYAHQFYTDDSAKIINDPEIELVYIASNHASHAEYAISALQAGKSVHIEKPHVVSEDQLVRLCETMNATKGKVNLGFNRPNSRIGKAIKQYIDSQSGAAMYNWFIAGHEISSDHWYFKDKEGGRVLGNLCHWTDFVLQLVDPENRYPIRINPTRGEKSDCDIAVTYTFGDGTIAAITFSAKGHTFEGVRESFSAHRGNVLISMSDFKDLVVEVVDKRYKISPLFRDHGHEANIKRSYEMLRASKNNKEQACTIDYVWDTGMLFLKTREALEKNTQLEVYPYSETTC